MVRGIDRVAWVPVVLAVVAGCASGDGVPTVTVENRFDDTCIVEANFLRYGFYGLNGAAIGPAGRMVPREVIEGSGPAYAVVMKASDGDCRSLGNASGGSLWVTNDPYEAKAGKLTTIAFSPVTAREVPVDCDDYEFLAGLERFARLQSHCVSPRPDAGAPVGDSGAD